MKNHLLIELAKREVPLELIELEVKEKVVYNIETQITEVYMGGQSTSCHKSTDGTQPKNEADRIMDDY